MSSTPTLPLAGRNVLVTGIADRASLSLEIGREILRQGGSPVCAGLGPTAWHATLSERAQTRFRETYESFCKTVESELGSGVPRFAFDISQDESIAELVDALRGQALAIDGVVHATAFDRTLRGDALSLLETPREAFFECMNVSAYSLVALLRELVRGEQLARGASVVALSYIGAERIVSHPYRNVAVAKAALERITTELAGELGRSHGARVNAVRFSPYTASRAGGAIPGLQEALEQAESRAPLGNARPDALALEVAHLLRPGIAVTGEIRHVDGGYHVLA